ncbi:hypothetical protein J3F84DRAFT_384567 [Trichoderma pleuroticola]
MSLLDLLRHPLPLQRPLASLHRHRPLPSQGAVAIPFNSLPGSERFFDVSGSGRPFAGAVGALRLYLPAPMSSLLLAYAAGAKLPELPGLC